KQRLALDARLSGAGAQPYQALPQPHLALLAAHLRALGADYRPFLGQTLQLVQVCPAVRVVHPRYERVAPLLLPRILREVRVGTPSQVAVEPLKGLGRIVALRLLLDRLGEAQRARVLR